MSAIRRCGADKPEIIAINNILKPFQCHGTYERNLPLRCDADKQQSCTNLSNVAMGEIPRCGAAKSRR